MSASSRPPTFDPTKLRLRPALNSASWVSAEQLSGKPITADMVDFDTCRADVHVNAAGVVHFYGVASAQSLLRMPAH